MHIKHVWKGTSRFATAILALNFAVTCAPVVRAEDRPSEAAPAQPAAASPAPAQPAATAQPSADTQQRLQYLEKEIAVLEQEIAALKASSTPAVTNAAYHPDAAVAAVNAPSARPDEKISLGGLLGPVTLSGFGDVYYQYNYNHPVDNTSGFRFFDAPTNSFGFNMAELILDKPPDAMTSDGRLGYHIAAGYGQAAKVVNGSDTPQFVNEGVPVFVEGPGFADGSNFYLKEAYLSYLAPIGKGLTVTVGKFVTPIGAEVIETNSNWNYSRSLLFYYAIPYFHFGASAKYAFNSKWSLAGYLVNGWNNTFIQHDLFPLTGQSTGMTYGASLAWTPTSKWSITENYFAGPVADAYANDVVTDWKQLSDTVISYTPNSKWAFMVNGDYGFGPRFYEFIDGKPTAPRPQGVIAETVESPAVKWWGAAGYAKYTLSPKTNFAVRYEYYEDPQGYTGLLFGDRGHAQEVTGTYSYNLTSGLLVRAEYRYDFASEPIFEKQIFNSVKEQSTATIGFIYSFSSANAK